MKTIDRATIRRYWMDKYLIRALAVLGTALVVPGCLLCLDTDFFQGQSFQLLGVWMVAFGLPIIIIVVAGFNEAFHKRKESWQYQLLDQWRRYSGRRLWKFPSSTVGMELLARQVILDLIWRAQQTNPCYIEEEKFHDEEKKIDWKSLSPRKGERLHKKLIKREQRIKIRVNNTKDWYLGFWDLVTEKGVGILAGPEWQDPESFRRNVLSAKDTAEVIMALEYY